MVHDEQKLSEWSKLCFEKGFPPLCYTKRSAHHPQPYLFKLNFWMVGLFCKALNFVCNAIVQHVGSHHLKFLIVWFVQLLQNTIRKFFKIEQKKIEWSFEKIKDSSIQLLVTSNCFHTFQSPNILSLCESTLFFLRPWLSILV